MKSWLSWSFTVSSLIGTQRVVLQVDPLRGEIRLALLLECARTFARVLVEHQLHVGEDLRLEALHGVEAEALVAGVLDRAVRLRRPLGELACKRHGALFE